MGKAIGIVSVKGGVGKTSVAVALGAVLANKYNKKVLIIDANLTAPSLGLHFGLITPANTIHDVLENKAKAIEAIYGTEYGLHIMPGSLSPSSYTEIDYNRMKETIEQLKEYYDFIFIDTPQLMNNKTSTFINWSDELLLVTTPDHVTISAALLSIKIAKQEKVPIMGVIMNKVQKKKFELQIEEIEKLTGNPVLAVLPFEINNGEALAKHMPCSLHKETEGTIEYNKVAAALVGKEYNDQRIKTKLLRLFKSLPKQESNRAVLRKENEKSIRAYLEAA